MRLAFPSAAVAIALASATETASVTDDRALALERTVAADLGDATEASPSASVVWGERVPPGGALPAVPRAVGPGKARRCQRGRACVPAASSSLGGRCRNEGEAARALRQEGSPRKADEQADEQENKEKRVRPPRRRVAGRPPRRRPGEGAAVPAGARVHSRSIVVARGAVPRRGGGGARPEAGGQPSEGGRAGERGDAVRLP